jgi:CxxC motif-containing protein (DUF1111 family)
LTTPGTPRRTRLLAGFGAVVLLVASSACSGSDGDTSSPEPPARASDAERAAQGGDATVYVQGRQAFGQPVPGMNGQDERTFAVGNSFFRDNWVTAPSSTEARDGLGPLLNAQSCSTCHFEDGRARPPDGPDDPERGLLLRLSVPGETPDDPPQPHPVFGDQLQDRAINGVPPEGTVLVTTTDKTGAYGDGTTYTLAEPHYEVVGPDGEPVLDDDVMVSPRIAPAMFGVGLLEGVPDEVLLDLEDPDDADGDGISGRVRRLPDPDDPDDHSDPDDPDTTLIGRFGWKAGAPSVKAQTAGAFAGDIGITSSLHPDQPCSDAPAEAACRAAPDGGDPEVSDERLDQVTFYARTLAVPARRDVGAETTDRGEELFDDVGCASCHVAALETGPSDIRALDRQTIRPYTDLLLHDMGPGLADDRPEGEATGVEWRTPPLWGIGLVETVNGHTRFLHDGRARNLAEAVLWHGGEAEAARERFADLPERDRRAVLAFLESL